MLYHFIDSQQIQNSEISGKTAVKREDSQTILLARPRKSRPLIATGKNIPHKQFALCIMRKEMRNGILRNVDSKIRRRKFR